MTVRSMGLLMRGLPLLAACGAVPWGAWWLVRDPLASLADLAGDGRTQQVPLETVVVGLCAAGLLVALGWLDAITVLALVAAATRELLPDARRGGPLTRRLRRADRRCPLPVRRLVAVRIGGASIGVALGAGLLAPALADPGLSPGLGGLRLPDRTTGAAMSTGTVLTLRPGPAHVPTRVPVREVTVRPGDSLWGVVAELLPTDASDAAITRAWHRLALANTARIGADPDLILPGTRLQIPDLTHPHRKETP